MFYVHIIYRNYIYIYNWHLMALERDIIYICILLTYVIRMCVYIYLHGRKMHVSSSNSIVEIWGRARGDDRQLGPQQVLSRGRRRLEGVVRAKSFCTGKLRSITPNEMWTAFVYVHIYIYTYVWDCVNNDEWLFSFQDFRVFSSLNEAAIILDKTGHDSPSISFDSLANSKCFYKVHGVDFYGQKWYKDRNNMKQPALNPWNVSPALEVRDGCPWLVPLLLTGQQSTHFVVV